MKIHTRMFSLGLAAAALAACGRKSDNAVSDTTAVRTDTTAMAPAAAMATTDSTRSAMAPAPITDANIFYELDQANMADSAEGSVAATKATEKGVHDFGRQMMTDHHKLRADGQALAKKLNITPMAATGDKSEQDGAAQLATLNSTDKGAPWDKAYVDMQVSDHQQVLAMLRAAGGQAQSPELKDMIAKATPIIQGHLDKALALQGKVGM